jgi:site-specific DNA-methyltransferase (adenine-specific)
LACFCSPSTQEVFSTAIAAAGWRLRSHVVWNRLIRGVGDTTATFAPMHDVVWFATKGRYRFPGPRLASVLGFRKVDAREKPHPTPKPPELLRSLVESLTRDGGLVLDPTCGAGSTGVGALLAGRRFIGIEIDPKHAATARRMLTATEQTVEAARD